MNEALVVVDGEGKVAYLNGSAQDLLGLTLEGAQGKSIREALGGRAGDFESPEELEALIGLADGQGDSASIAVKLVSPKPRDLEVSSFSIPAGSNETMTGLLARDVTQERELQDRRDAFVSIASHELRTPMTSIMGFSELMLNNASAPDASRRDWLERIHQNSQVLAAIVEDMLNVSRIQSGKLEINIEELSLDEVVREVVEGIRPDVGNRELVSEIPDETPGVFADRDKLAQVIRNLVSNAVKYSPGGEEVTIAASHEPDNERVVVEVRDRGMGISPANLDTLFSSFVRIRRPETEGIRGTGLGLSIVKGLASLIGGEVWVESELDKGSTFFFTVPTNRVEAGAAQEQGALPAI